MSELKKDLPFQTSEEMNEYLKKIPGGVLYVSTPECNVCKVLKPKVRDLVNNRFSKLEFHYIDATRYPEIAGQLSVFAVPTVLVYMDGKEWFRKSRHLSLSELHDSISRPYSMMFEE